MSIFAPERGTGTDWKPKHLLKWRGPMEVVAILSPTTYRVQERSSGRTFERTVANISPYRADPDLAPSSGVPLAYAVGDRVATRKTL